jgi:hypothetical protein
MSAHSLTLPLVWFTSAHMVPKSRLMRTITISHVETDGGIGNSIFEHKLDHI